MTIKQQGGVFGRNPTFNDVDVEGDLTVGGSVTHTGTQNITGQLNVDNVRIDGNTVSTTDTNGNLLLKPNGTGAVLTSKPITGINTRVTRKILNNWSGQGNGAGFENTARYEVAAGNDTVQAFLAAGYNSAGKYPNVGAVGTLTNHPLAVHINNSKVAEFTTSGNLAFNNGLGIDFSATSGTGTSELFDDYEEGTFTPTVSDAASGGNTGSTTAAVGHYVKVGRVVTVAVDLVNIDTTGLTSGNYLYIGGLPFTAFSGSGSPAWTGSVLGANTWTSITTGIVSNVLENTDYIRFIKDTDAATGSYLTVGDVNSGATDVRFSMTYFAA
jgi:hypothetical protein